MGGGNGQKSKMAREKNMEKQKNAARGSQLESNKKAMSIQECIAVFIAILRTLAGLPYTPWYDRAPCDKRETLIDHSWNDLQPAVEASGSWEAYRVHGKHGHRGRRK
uniref:Small EDRK-rich factor-like N-terminal domain-containing protein n=1 Tax=Vitis vinifera TaxID=29760 RepID=F6GZN4_VITVI